MALPGHSPPPYATAGSPPRLINGQPEHHFPQPMFAPPRPMLPPSPQQFAPRYPVLHHQMPQPAPMYDMRAPAPAPIPPAPVAYHPPPPPPTHKRPGSSMSISNLIGQDQDRNSHDRSQPLNHLPPRSNTSTTSGMPVTAMMSPPHQPARIGMPEYSSKPRSRTPDRLENLLPGSRQRSQSSGTSMMHHRPLYESYDHYAKPPTTQFSQSLPFANPPATREEHEHLLRKDGLSQILRPNSQPLNAPSTQPTRVFDPLPAHRQGWYADPPPPFQEQPRPAPSGAYDTKPPGFRDIPRTIPTTQATPSTSVQSTSPDIRRTSINGGTFNRGLANLLNMPPNQSGEAVNSVSQHMIRQDSSQSQSDRSAHGDRLRVRNFSPFAAPNNAHSAQGSGEDQGRKGSDEISHKTIIGLGLESRRGRWSPVPQPVQGPQARTPVPDGGPRSEQGRVFSGLGGGAGPSPSPMTAVNGSLKAEDTLSRAHDAAIKPGRSAPSIGKRSRKVQDDETRGDTEQSEGKKGGSLGKGNKRPKYQNSYKADLEEMASPSLPRRGTPLTATTARRGVAPHNVSTPSNLNPRYDIAPIFKPKKTVKINTVASQILRKPRRHLGSFKYEPDLLVPEGATRVESDSDIGVKPKLLPSFSGVEDLNCTYTMQISKTWLQDRERKLICSSRSLWGTGIYTDDSDPVAAAMHMGWIKPAFNASVDENLLQRIVQDQNPKIEIPKELKPPAQALDVGKGKDIKITCVVMPQLEAYAETARFGVRSRNWPSGAENTPHDGVSFSILKVEIVDIGPEEKRIGRTGESKRARLRAQMEQRVRATRLEAERVERVMKRIKEREEKQKLEDSQKKKQTTAKTSSPLINEVLMDTGSATTAKSAAIVDGDEWRRQLATAAA